MRDAASVGWSSVTAWESPTARAGNGDYLSLSASSGDRLGAERWVGERGELGHSLAKSCSPLGFPLRQTGIGSHCQVGIDLTSAPTHLEKAPRENSVQGLGTLGDPARNAGFKGRSQIKAACTHVQL